MLMPLHIDCPLEPFHTDRQRSAVMTVHAETPSQVPSLAEPWFLHCQARYEFRIAMTPADLQASGLEAPGTKWA
jgi:hypothetical protein